MKRALLTASELIRKFQTQHWGKFDDALSRKDEEILDRFFEHAKYSVRALALMPATTQTMMVSVLIELRKGVMALTGTPRERRREVHRDSIVNLTRKKEDNSHGR
jgi:hypothetical protein